MIAGPDGVSGNAKEIKRPSQELTKEKTTPSPICPVILTAQQRAAVAGRISKPTAMRVPIVLKAPSKLRTSRTMKACSVTHVFAVCDSKKAGSHVLIINGRRSHGKETSVIVATKPSSNSDSSSSPRIEPNKKLFNGTADPLQRVGGLTSTGRHIGDSKRPTLAPERVRSAPLLRTYIGIQLPSLRTPASNKNKIREMEVKKQKEYRKIEVKVKQ